MADLDQHLPAIVAGDPDAFGRWVAGAEPRLRDSLRPLAARVDTEAVLQESLLRMWQVAPRFVSDGKPDGLLRLGIRIARNLAFDELRRRRVDPASHRSARSRARRRRRAPADSDARSAPAPGDRRVPRTSSAANQRARSTRASRPHGGDSDEISPRASSMRLNTFLQNVTRARRLLADCLKKPRRRPRGGAMSERDDREALIEAAATAWRPRSATRRAARSPRLARSRRGRPRRILRGGAPNARPRSGARSGRPVDHRARRAGAPHAPSLIRARTWRVGRSRSRSAACR